jgi:hypothetical protein
MARETDTIQIVYSTLMEKYGSRYSQNSINNPYATDTPKLYDRQGRYRGKLSSNPYDPDSISNPYGRYGSRYSPDSINNPYGAGNPYRYDSPTNPYGSVFPTLFHEGKTFLRNPDVLGPDRPHKKFCLVLFFYCICHSCPQRYGRLIISTN